MDVIQNLHFGDGRELLLPVFILKDFAVVHESMEVVLVGGDFDLKKEATTVEPMHCAKKCPTLRHASE